MSSFKLSRIAPLFLLAALCTIALLTSCGKSDLSTSSGGVGATPPASALTAITSCVIDSENDVVIGGPDAPAGCQNVEMDPSGNSSVPFGEIQIAAGGTLHIEGAAPGSSNQGASIARDSIPLVPLEPVQTICVEDGGKLEFGSADKPITDSNKVVLRFVGNRNSGGSGKLCAGDPDFNKGIVVEAGGSLLMYGAKGVPKYDSQGNNIGGVSWTTLAAPAGSNVPGAKVASRGTKTLALTANVTQGPEGWQPGDWIVVATTDYVPFHSEFVQIATVRAGGVNSAGSTVTLQQPLKYYHFGSLAPSSASATCPDPLYPAHSATSTQPAFLCDGADKNYGVDERAEVGFISRDIELKAVTEAVTKVPPPATSSVYWGGEIMIHAGFKQVAIQGVRLSKFGKDKLGSYPIHFHMIGDADNKPLINADSVDHSYNKCVTIHDTSNLTIQNMVCARIVGHIFYEELDSTTTADDSGITFKNDLGLGSMSNSFDINPVTVNGKQISRAQLIKDYWWTGDYMTNDSASPNYIGYDGFNIPDTDNWLQPTHGSCTKFGPDGGLSGYLPPNQASTTAACPPAAPPPPPPPAKPPPPPDAPIYVEPASGFWIQNPNTNLIGNAIAGCQGVGRGYWWVTPPTPINVNGIQKTLGFDPLGTFENNRANGCYSGFYGESEYSVISQVMTPHVDAQPGDQPVIATLDGMTATRNRFRGVWLRPVWFAITNGHFASNRENVSLVTSGGIDGNAPGVWDLLEDSIVVGFSENNVGRWGPCPNESQLGPNTGSLFGCIDHTPGGQAAHSGDEVGQGYTQPSWNDFGYMLYDGPVRVFHDRFVNFNYDDHDPNGTGDEFSSELDTADRKFLQNYSSSHQSPTGQKPFVYEGDAAFGWFQSNQSAYPTGTATRELMWTNTNLRHQIYTELVGVNTNFNDGDKNTAIIDEDGTFTGLGVQLAPGAGSSPVHAISLNNLPFNSTSNAVEECLSIGGQNALYEGRDSSLMSPSSMGTLEFSNLYPFIKDKVTNPDDYPGDTNTHWQNMTFTRDDQVPDGKGGMFHPDMTLQTGRNGLGIWEPKVANSYGYTVTVAKTTSPSAPSDQKSGKAGIWKWIDIGLADIVDPNISAAHPFYIRLGISYTNTNGTHPADNFTITRGYKSYIGGSVYPNDPELLKYWTQLDCNNIDANNVANVPWSGNNFEGNCPSGPTTTLSEASSIAGLTNPDGTPNLTKYYYDQTTGYLYLNVAQDEPNPVGPSPLGSCHADGTGDASCPNFKHGESYYVCPKNGCIIYTIAQNDPNYNPGPSVGQPAPADAKAVPTNENKLVLHGTNTVITRTIHLDKQGHPYYTANNGPVCPATEPPQ